MIVATIKRLALKGKKLVSIVEEGSEIIATWHGDVRLIFRGDGYDQPYTVYVVDKFWKPTMEWMRYCTKNNTTLIIDLMADMARYE